MFLYRLFFLGAALVVGLLYPFQPKVRSGIAGRFGLIQRIRKFRARCVQTPYWFHFASSGEFEQAIPILDALRREEPGSAVCITYFSPSGKRAVELEIARRTQAGLPLSWDYADFSPLDSVWSVRAFLSALDPRALVVLNREFWPEMFHQCFRASIPVYVFAAFFSRRARGVSWLYGPWLKRTAYFGTCDLSTAQFLKSILDESRVGLLGDPRIERVLERKKLKARRGDSRAFDTRPCFVAASLWPEDFEALQHSLQHLGAVLGWRLFLVPHEPEEKFIRKLEKWCLAHSLTVCRWSQNNSELLSQAVIVDSVGWLAELYEHADLAFVGGAFKKRVHNVLEPAAYGIAVITGPHIQNSIEAMEMHRFSEGVFSVRTPQELSAVVAHLAEDVSARKTQGSLAQGYIQKRVGAGSLYARALLGRPFLPMGS